MNIYDEKAWKRLVATAGAVGRTANSTFMDGRQADSTAAFSGGVSASGGEDLVFVAYEPPKNRWHILRASAASSVST